MGTTTFREKLRRGDLLVGTLLTLRSPEVAEILSLVGFDWLFLDLEHSAMGSSDAQQLLQGIGGRTPTLVRVESRDEVGIRKALDIGPDGIIVPHVTSRSDAERIVELAKYPPAGIRGIGAGRASGYGNNIFDYMARANDETVVVVQIEHIDALPEVDAIAAVEGIDAMFVGPFDLSASVGKPGMVDEPEVKTAIAKVLEVAGSRGKTAGIFAGSAAVAKGNIAQGFSLIAMATDSMFLGRAAAAELEPLKR